MNPMTSRITLITAGDPYRLTGGNLYNRHVIQAIRRAGLIPTEIVLPLEDPLFAGRMLRAGLMEQRPAMVMVDSIALDAAAPFAVWIRHYLGARLLALMHMLPSTIAPEWRKATLQRLEYQLLSVADRVVTPSDSIGQRLVRAGAVPEQISVIAPGKDGVPALPAASEKCDGLKFLCVANWSPSKGIHTLVEAMARLPSETELDLVGDEGGAAYSSYVRDLIRWNLLEQRVHLYGPLEGEELARRYASADVFVLPSASESFGIVYAEAMAFGLPVIACRVGPLPWLVEEDCGILVPIDDAGTLAAAMRTIASDGSRRGCMSQAALRRTASLPTWRESADRFAGLVRDLLGAPGVGVRSAPTNMI